jgi:hypothetical protein
MHPEILRELTAQRGRELREQAHRASLARHARRTLRDWRRGHRAVQADEFVVPAIPDYVDGSFRTAGDEVASNVQDNVPATHRAA